MFSHLYNFEEIKEPDLWWILILEILFFQSKSEGCDKLIFLHLHLKGHRQHHAPHFLLRSIDSHHTHNDPHGGLSHNRQRWMRERAFLLRKTLTLKLSPFSSLPSLLQWVASHLFFTFSPLSLLPLSPSLLLSLPPATSWCGCGEGECGLCGVVPHSGHPHSECVKWWRHHRGLEG